MPDEFGSKLYYLDFIGNYHDLPNCSNFLDCGTRACYRCEDCDKLFCVVCGRKHREVKCA
ncbi:MAG TPA: hypothetical protein VLA89_03255 [Gemmatimonadales bacterium]|nr:hypothetical protein [Gemmatimonadales bacterium]